MRVIAIGAILGLAACSTVIVPTPAATPPTAAHLRTISRGSGCYPTNIGPFRLEGDPQAEEGEQVWLVAVESMGLVDAGDIVWPIWRSGWSGAFTPELRIFDEDGEVVLTEGNVFQGAALYEPADNTLYVCGPDKLPVP
jgi:hypothetical protein